MWQQGKSTCLEKFQIGSSHFGVLDLKVSKMMQFHRMVPKRELLGTIESLVCCY